MRYPYFAKNLKALRVINKLSQEQLAEKIHVSPAAISNWEAGYITPRRSSLLRLSFCFGEDLEDILYESKKYVAEAEKITGKPLNST